MKYVVEFVAQTVGVDAVLVLEAVKRIDLLNLFVQLGRQTATIACQVNHIILFEVSFSKFLEQGEASFDSLLRKLLLIVLIVKCHGCQERVKLLVDALVFREELVSNYCQEFGGLEGIILMPGFG